MENLNFMIVEDIDSVQNMMCSMIKRIFSNLNIVCFDNGNDAIEEIKSRRYDLILLDVNLGKGSMNGVEILVKIKDINPEQKVYMITGYPIPNEEAEIIKDK